MKALIVEDDKHARDVVADELVELGLGVVAVEHLDGARAAWREHAFDLVLLDNNFPREQGGHPERLGMRVAAMFRRVSDVPIILWTGDDLGDLQAEADRLKVHLVAKGFGALSQIVAIAGKMRRAG